MKKYLLSIPAALGLLALVPTNSKAQDFNFSVQNQLVEKIEE